MITIHEATSIEINLIRDLMQPYVTEGIVLERSYEEIEAELPCFFVAMMDNELAGVVSYHDYESGLYEIRSLVVAEKYKKQSVGSLLVRYVIDILRPSNEKSRIFALTYVPPFFETLNFEQLDKDLLPEKIWKDCYKCPRKDNCKEIALIYRG